MSVFFWSAAKHDVYDEGDGTMSGEMQVNRHEFPTNPWSTSSKLSSIDDSEPAAIATADEHLLPSLRINNKANLSNSCLIPIRLTSRPSQNDHDRRRTVQLQHRNLIRIPLEKKYPLQKRTFYQKTIFAKFHVSKYKVLS